jgi:Sap-like sulfolipid-1-addressing protein
LEARVLAPLISFGGCGSGIGAQNPGVSLAQILPLAFVMVAGPQILSSFFLATTPDWAKNSLAYAGGAALSITTFATIAYFVAKGAKEGASSGQQHTVNHVIDWVILALLLVLIARVYLTRKTSRPPKWMGRLQTAEPKFAFTLGVLLLGVFPTDILTSVTAGLHVGRHGEAWWHLLPFVGLTLLLLGAPALGVLLLGRRAATLLPKVRDWMTNNSWVVSEIVLALFIALTAKSLAG